MILGTVIPPKGPRLLGQTEVPLLSSGTEFKCNDSICYGIGAIHPTFQRLQEQMNRFSGLLNFTPIAVDGFIGATTTKTLAALSAVVPGQAMAAFMMAGATKEAAAQLAVKLFHELLGAADRLEAEQALPPPKKAVVVATAPRPAAAPAPAATLPAKSSSHTGWWIAGGVVAAVAAGVTVAVVVRSRRNRRAAVPVGRRPGTMQPGYGHVYPFPY